MSGNPPPVGPKIPVDALRGLLAAAGVENAHAVLDGAPAEMITIIIRLCERSLALEAQVKALKARLAQNSSNSSRPPSSDGYAKPQPKSQRTKTGRRSGGQPGHPGHTLQPAKHPDHVEIVPPAQRCSCGCELSDDAVIEFERRQVFDLPPIHVHVTEYRAPIRVCKRCGKRLRGEFAPDVTQPVQYGPGVQAAVAYLSQYQLLPYERLQELLRDLFELELSQGTLETILNRTYEKLETFENTVKEKIIHGGTAHFDETGARVKKQLHWLHVASTPTLTTYHIDPKRGVPAMQRMGVLPHFRGRAVHDHWASYFAFACRHFLCNAHHLRELTFAEEQYQQAWAGHLKQCLLQANREVTQAKAQGHTALPAQRVAYFCNRYSRILRQGRPELPQLPPNPGPRRGRVKQHKVKNLHERLRQFKTETLGFLHDFSVPFTNNQAEQDERMAKVKHKISGCFRSLQGARIFARARGYFSTLKKQRLNVLDTTTLLFKDPEAFRRLTEPIA